MAPDKAAEGRNSRDNLKRQSQTVSPNTAASGGVEVVVVVVEVVLSSCTTKRVGHKNNEASESEATDFVDGPKHTKRV